MLRQGAQACDSLSEIIAGHQIGEWLALGDSSLQVGFCVVEHPFKFCVAEARDWRIGRSGRHEVRVAASGGDINEVGG